ncbi:MAG TPA: ankyrin repeat domain-containing protein [Vicinamibacteria bacterium]|jgi:ankyrin repeat protein
MDPNMGAWPRTSVFVASAAFLLFSFCTVARDNAAGELRLRGIEPTQPSLNQAILAGDTETVDLLLDAGVTSRRGLGLAAKEGRCNILRRILEADSPVEEILAAEALAWALHNEHGECVQSLEAAGADLRAVSRAGETVLTMTAHDGDIAFLEVLISFGLDPNSPNGNGRTALIRAVEAKRPKSIRALLKSGADVNVTDLDGWTPLAYAVRDGRHTLVRLLIESGADVNRPTKTGWTPLTFAATEGHGRVLRTLLAARADPNTASEASLTPLMRAAQRGDRRMVQTLLRAGAVPTLSIDGVDAAWWAGAAGHRELNELLTAASTPGSSRS